MKRAAVLTLCLILSGFAINAVLGNRGQQELNYRMVAIERGDLEATISATGTLEAVTMVQVGTQVSGTINELYADYNDYVSEGQALARIDPTLLLSAVATANIELERARAELDLARHEYERLSPLHEDGLVSDRDLNQIQYSLDIARASVSMADIALARAEDNLRYATITSPIDGIVVARSMEVGQTVQASFSAPELFQIAGDLSYMQIIATVDESDIGQIEDGQKTRFTVQAYPEEKFTGVVRQVRLQSSTVENVVSYTVAIDVSNPAGLLLPGMTATVDFLVETATDVLYVANSALRYQPEDSVASLAVERMRAEREGVRERDPSAERERRSSGTRSGNQGMLWTTDEAGSIKLITVRTGISDGSNTVVRGSALEAGQQVIAGVTKSVAGQESTSSPFQQSAAASRSSRPRSPAGSGR